jgi:hypothetical protein
MKRFFLFSFFCFSFCNAKMLLAQVAPSIEWQKCLGGNGFDYAYSVQQTSDGGFIIAGYSGSNDVDASGNHGGNDYWVVKLDASGLITWQKSLGGSDDDRAATVQQTTDGGYIVAGFSSSTDGDVTGNHGSSDAWIVRLNSSGNISWQKSLGGSAADQALFIQQTSDGGFVFSGSSASNNGDVSGNHGGPTDCWVVKLDASGNITWQKCLGGNDSDFSRSIRQTSDGGYIVAATAKSTNGDVTQNHGDYDFWIVKLLSSGNIDWQKCLGGSSGEDANDIRQTVDGGYIVAGYSHSTDGDVSGGHGADDALIFKLTSSGDITWQKCFGGTSWDAAASIQQTLDGGFVFTGDVWSDDGDASGNHGVDDVWVVKIDASGNLTWQKCLGGSGGEYALSIQQTTDLGFIIAGYTTSNDEDVSGYKGGPADMWIIKLEGTTGIDETGNSISPLAIFPNPATSFFYLQLQLPLTENSEAEITITNMVGVEVFQKRSAIINSKLEVTISLNEIFSEGIYVVSVIYNAQQKEQALIVIK